MDHDVPLVVPEVNPSQVRNRPKGIIANPNCTTLTMMVAIGALHREYGLRELVVASYQAVSGAGQPGVDRLLRRARRRAGKGAGSSGDVAGDVRAGLGEDLAVPRPAGVERRAVGRFARDDGWSSEELKVRNESRKILGIPDLKVSATCVRVPVVTTHSLAVHAVFAERGRPSTRRAQGARGQPSVVLIDDPAVGGVPDTRGRRRLRPDLRRPDPAGAGLPEHPGPVRLRRQPAQGRRAQHLRDRRDGGRRNGREGLVGGRRRSG